MATKMVDLGIKRKEMHSAETSATPKGEKDYENEKVCPELETSGPHAEMMGAESVKQGDHIRQTVEWHVKRHTTTTENGKTEYRMTLELVKASDCEECESEKPKKKSDADDGDGADDSPAMAYIQGRAARN